MTNDQLLMLDLIEVLLGLASAIYYLTVAVAKLSIVGLIGYIVALRAARAPR